MVQRGGVRSVHRGPWPPEALRGHRLRFPLDPKFDYVILGLRLDQPKRGSPIAPREAHQRPRLTQKSERLVRSIEQESKQLAQI